MKERYFTFIMYEDSRPKEWKEILQSTGLQFAISPRHDKDINPTGEKKKPHYHVLIIFNGPSTLKNANKISESVNGTICQPVKSTTGIIRYFSHKDNPEKAQYNENEITGINGIEIEDLCNELTQSKIEILKREIVHLICSLGFTEYAETYDYLDKEDLKEYIKVFSNNTYFFKAYLQSKHFTKEEKELLNKTNKYDIIKS